MYYIYEIYNDVTQKRYIGLSERPARRFQRHLTQLRNHTHTAEGINKDFIQFGEEHFFLRIIDKADTKEIGLIKEKHHIINSRSYVPEYGYNGHDPRWNKRVRTKAIDDSELKKAIIEKGYKLSEIPWILNLRQPVFAIKMNNQELFTKEEMEALEDMVKNTPMDWWKRNEYLKGIKLRMKSIKKEGE